MGSLESARSIVDCLRALEQASSGLATETIVVDSSSDHTASIVRNEFPGVSFRAMPPGTLTPMLWAEGIRMARGRYVGLTTGHCVVPSEWISALTGALRGSVVGAGGPLALLTKASRLDAAIYFLRYSAFMPSRSDAVSIVHEIAGDNAMYSGDALRRHESTFAGGFWEPEFHKLLRAEGGQLAIVPRASAAFGRSFPLGVISRHRFSHGKRFGSWRVASAQMSAARVILAAPVVPFVLLVRIAARVMRNLSARRDFLGASPIVLWLAACWAAGEAVGAFEARRANRS